MINLAPNPIALIIRNGGARRWSILYSDERGALGAVGNHDTVLEAIKIANFNGYDTILSKDAEDALKGKEK
jgi:hypothetical protein